MKCCRGQNMYMLGFTLTAISRYHRITNDPEVLKALSVGIDQIIREAWSEEHQSFYLTSCVHQRNSPPPGFCSATFHASEAFAYETSLTGNAEHHRIMPAALQSGIRAGPASDRRRRAAGQTGYYSGVFHSHRSPCRCWPRNERVIFVLLVANLLPDVS